MSDNEPIRPDWKTNKETRRFIFEVIVLRILWAIWYQVSGQKVKADHVIGMALLDTVDYVEANKINERSTRDTIKASFGW